MSGHYRYLLIGYSRQDLEFVGAAAGGTVNVALNILLTPVYGIQAAAWSLIVSEIIIWGLTYYFTRFAISQTQTRPLFGVAVGGSVDGRS
jgi:O-antigen/teichoic acid export membrane protein